MGLLARVRGGWDADPLWGVVYDFLVEHPVVGRPAWAVGLGSDLLRLHAACDEISELPAGSRVLDLPCGGGVALRGLRSAQSVTYVAGDIAPEMLARTHDAARARGVDHLVSLARVDAGALGFADASYDLVVSLTGLHCFPDPEAAVLEIGRVLRPGGVVVGSALLNDTGWRFEPLRRAGRAGGLVGPSCTSDELVQWLTRAGIGSVTLELSGALGYFRGVREG